VCLALALALACPPLLLPPLLLLLLRPLVGKVLLPIRHDGGNARVQH
jgi:hypothetical protein